MSNHWYNSVYLHSDHWFSLKTLKLEQSPSCERCESRTRLEVHHLRYLSNLMDCTTKDLETLCRKCHQTVHAKRDASNEADAFNFQKWQKERKQLWLAAQNVNVVPTKPVGAKKPKLKKLQRVCKIKSAKYEPQEILVWFPQICLR